MSRYLLRRLMIVVPSLLGISLVLFTVLALAPGDPFGELATNPNVPPEVGAALRAKFGLDDPVWLRYLHWLVAMLHGDWGFSFVSRMDVDILILQRLPATLLVIGSSQLLALLVALPVGVLAATRPYSIFDQIANTVAFIGFSLPTFFTGILFILIFSIYLDWLPFVFRADIAATGWRWYWEMFRQAIMPVAVLGLFQGAALTRYVRSAVLDVIRLDYVTTARAKGIAERAVITKHVVRNALIPVVTLVALPMPAVFGGAITTEQISPVRHRRSRPGPVRAHALWRPHLACRRAFGDGGRGCRWHYRRLGRRHVARLGRCRADVADRSVPVAARTAGAAAADLPVSRSVEAARWARARRLFPDRRGDRRLPLDAGGAARAGAVPVVAREGVRRGGTRARRVEMASGGAPHPAQFAGAGDRRRQRRCRRRDHPRIDAVVSRARLSA